MKKAISELQKLIDGHEAKLYDLRLKLEAANDNNDVQAQLKIAQDITKITNEIETYRKLQLEWEGR